VERKIGFSLTVVSVILGIVALWITVDYNENNNNNPDIQEMQETLNQLIESQKSIYAELGIEIPIDTTKEIEIPPEILQ